MKRIHIALVACLGLLAVTTLMAFNNSVQETAMYHQYQCIVASSDQTAINIVISANSKPFREFKYSNRENAYDLSPALNLVVEREKLGWELVSSNISRDEKNDRVVCMFLMGKRTGK